MEVTLNTFKDFRMDKLVAAHDSAVTIDDHQDFYLVSVPYAKTEVEDLLRLAETHDLRRITEHACLNDQVAVAVLDKAMRPQSWYNVVFAQTAGGWIGCQG